MWALAPFSHWIFLNKGGLHDEVAVQERHHVPAPGVLCQQGARLPFARVSPEAINEIKLLPALAAVRFESELVDAREELAHPRRGDKPIDGNYSGRVLTNTAQIEKRRTANTR
jgi:hypothetical protein